MKTAPAGLDLVLAYLRDLEANNDREWYAAHKAERLAAEAQFESLISAIQDGVATFAPGASSYQPSSLTFKLQRDTRFSKDKSPYNPTFRAHIGPAGKVFIPMGPYLAVRAGNRSILGGGMFAHMFSDATRRIRDALVAQPKRWLSVVDNLGMPVMGEALKNVPKGYPADHPCAQHLKNKSWYTEIPITDKHLVGEGFVNWAIEMFAAMQPLNDFLNEALTDFQMPKRQTNH